MLNLSIAVFYFMGFFGVNVPTPVNVRKVKKNVNKDKQK